MADLSNVNLAQQIASLSLNPARRTVVEDPVRVEEGLRRVTLSQAASARPLPNGIYELGGKPFKYIETVASVFDTITSEGRHQFVLLDDSGRIKASLRGSEDESHFEEAGTFSSWDYAHIYGELETWNGRNSIRIKTIRKLHDPHEPYYHLLGVMYEIQSTLQLPASGKKDQAANSEDEYEELWTVDYSLEEAYYATPPPGGVPPPSTSAQRVPQDCASQKPPTAQPKSQQTPQRSQAAPSAETSSSEARMPGEFLETESVASEETVTPARRQGIAAWAQRIAGSIVSPSRASASSDSSSRTQHDQGQVTPQKVNKVNDVPAGVTPQDEPNRRSKARNSFAPVDTSQFPKPVFKAKAEEPFKSESSSSRQSERREATKVEIQKVIMKYLVKHAESDDESIGCELKKMIEYAQGWAQRRRLILSQNLLTSALDNLLHDGRIYTTIDEVHFSPNVA